MKSHLLPAAIAVSLVTFLASCGGEKTGEEENKKPAIAETKTVQKEEKEKPDQPEKTDEEIARDERRASREKRGKEMFEERDANGDGLLTQEEATNLGWLMAEQADTDGDGKVSYEDIQLAFKERRIKPPTPTRTIEVMDTDGDGAIGGDEIPEQFRQGIPMVDIDGDSKVSLSELENMQRMMEQRRSQFQGGGNGPGEGDVPPL